nr:TPA_asm: ND2 [Bombus convexus]
MLTNKFFMMSGLLILSMFSIMMSSESIYIKWLMMELSTTISIGLINIDSSNKIISMLYYIISTISGLFIIVIISMNFSFFMMNTSLINNILMISMFLKLGIFPFWFWMIYIYNMANWFQIFMLSTLMKFIPIYFFSNVLYLTMYMVTFIFINNFLLSLYTNYKFNMNKLLSCSSIFNSSYLLLILYSNDSLFIILTFLYLINFILLTYMMNFYKITNLDFNYVPSNTMNLIKILLFSYSSFPMFTSFIYKWELFMSLSNFNINNNTLMIMLLSNIIMMWNYFIVMKYMNLKFKTFTLKIKFKSPYFIIIIFMIFIYTFSFMYYNMI